MTHIYEKNVKDMVDFPAYVTCFLGAIMNKLEFYGFINGKPGKISNEHPNKLIIPIVSRRFKYCYDGIALIEKTLKRRGFDCRMSRFKLEDIKNEDGTKSEGYSYEYHITKAK